MVYLEKNLRKRKGNNVTVEKSCGFIIYRKEEDEIKFLLLKRADKKEEYLEIPKGHIHEHESEIDCARRELFEETHLQNLKLIPNVILKTSYISSHTKDEKQFVFFVASTDDKIVLSKEHTDFKFVVLSRAKKILHEDWCRLLSQAEDRIKIEKK